MQSKEQLRQALKQRRDALDSGEKQLWQTRIYQELWKLPQYKAAKLLMTYLPFGSEFDTWPIVTKAWEEGKRVTVPKMVTKPTKRLAVVEICSKADLHPGLWGILEPIFDQELDPGCLDLIVVPGLAFSQTGYRLGYGAGYYDNLLPKTQGYKVGLCFNQFIQDVPLDPWDYPVDLVISEQAIYEKGNTHLLQK